MKFCSQCGHTVALSIPDGDNRERFICQSEICATIHYQNPNIITGCLLTHQDKVLLCKRAIEPKYGLWTLPAGFMENGETTEQGAIRESWEEARAKATISQLYAIYNLPHINQVYFIYKGELCDLQFSAGEESLAVDLFSEQDIPWDTLAFTVVAKTLKHYFDNRRKSNSSEKFSLYTENISPNKQILTL